MMHSDIHESRVYYNIVEANATIPRLELLFAELGRIQGEVNELSRQAREQGVEIDPDAIELGGDESEGLHGIEERMAALTAEYADRLADIDDLGVIVDDLDSGVVNFYSWIKGREVFLSWQTGEPEISHWHAVTENSIARRHIKHLIKSHRPAEISLH